MSNIKQNIRKSFGSHVDEYDLHGIIQKQAAQILFDEAVKQVDIRSVASILEIGCGTGFLSEHIVKHFKDATHVISDLSTDMVIKCREKLSDTISISTLPSSSQTRAPTPLSLRAQRGNPSSPHTRRKLGCRAALAMTVDGGSRARADDGRNGAHPLYLVCDGENLPFSTEFSPDLVMANLSLHWFQNFESSLRNLFDITTKLLAFSVPALGTFRAWALAHERLGIKNRMVQFHSVTDLEKILSNLKPKNFSIKTVQLSQKLPSAIKLLSHLKSIGASPNINPTSYQYTAAELRALCREVDMASNDIANYEIAICILEKHN
jgi:ubiquinone/menaquinone biosynthesis C-methylase UbiE